jgi:type II secretory pathway pseudopilin PulG
MKIKKIKKQSMTLLEVMLVIGMLAMLGSFLAFKAKDLLDIYGFRQEVSLLKGRCELARQYALSYQADVEVHFSISQGRMRCELRSDEPYLHAHPLFCKPCVLKKIQKITQADTGERAASLLFSGTGWMFPITNLKVYSTDKKSSTAIIPIGNNLQ